MICFASYSLFFSKNFRVYAIFNEQIFNDMLTNDIVSFEQLGPDIFYLYSSTCKLLGYSAAICYIMYMNSFIYLITPRGILAPSQPPPPPPPHPYPLPTTHTHPNSDRVSSTQHSVLQCWYQYRGTAMSRF